MSDTVARAREVLARYKAEQEPGPPAGVFTLADIAEAERRLAAAQREKRDYSASDDGLRSTVDSDGLTGTVVERWRMEKLQLLQNKIEKRFRDLDTIKAAWMEGLAK